jgi:RNA polymerase sigma factor (sigma-70 family)
MPLQTPMHELSDEHLMQAYAAGDVAAFDVLYARHEGPLFRFVRRVLGSKLTAQADEVFQDCWLRIVTARDTFAPERGRWKTWAYTVAHNLAMDRLRVSGREVSLEGMKDVDDGGSAGDGASGGDLDWLRATLNNPQHPALDANPASTEDIAHWRAAGQQLLRCLDALPAVQRAAFLLHHEDGSSVEDLAQALGLGFETAKSRLRYALQKLRGCMQDYLTVWEAA